MPIGIQLRLPRTTWPDTCTIGATLSWKAAPEARGHAVYRVDGQPGSCATADARNLVAVVPAGERFTAKAAGTYLVTALDRLHNESEPAQISVKIG